MKVSIYVHTYMQFHRRNFAWEFIKNNELCHNNTSLSFAKLQDLEGFVKFRKRNYWSWDMKKVESKKEERDEQCAHECDKKETRKWQPYWWEMSISSPGGWRWTLQNRTISDDSAPSWLGWELIDFRRNERAWSVYRYNKLLLSKLPIKNW